MQNLAIFKKSFFLVLIFFGQMFAIYYLNPPFVNPIQVVNKKIDLSESINEHSMVNLDGRWFFLLMSFV